LFSGGPRGGKILNPPQTREERELKPKKQLPQSMDGITRAKNFIP